jgi:hypothetical protein
MKTAVQWLEEQINGNELFYIDDLFEQAKEMEKQQLNNAYNDDRPNLTCYEENTAFNDYYNKTFKK